MFVCSLCERETCYIAQHCPKCRQIKHLLNLYGDRVYEVLNCVLVRNEKAIAKKTELELKTEKTKLESKINGELRL